MTATTGLTDATTRERDIALLTSRILWLESEIRRAKWQRDELVKEAGKGKT